MTNLTIKNITLCTLLILASPFLYAETNNITAQLNIEVFDGLCVQNFDNYSTIDQMSNAFGGKEIPKDMQNADPAMRQMGGKSFYFPYKGKKYIVGYTFGGGCSIASKNIDAKNLSKLLIKNYNAILIDTQPTGAQVNETYQIRNTTIHNGALITLAYPRQDTDYKEGSIGFISASTAKKMLVK